MLDTLEGRIPLARRHLEEGLAVAEDCQAGKCLAIGQAMMARLERLAGHPNHALELAAESVSTARQINLTCQEMWGEIEMGLAYLALGDPSSALEHTGCAASLAPRIGQDWIGCEEVCQVHANILRTMSQEEAAEQYQRCAKETTQAKAELIPDPLQRCRFLVTST
jgi:tetratricopeptide (TPR) repeat protein